MKSKGKKELQEEKYMSDYERLCNFIMRKQGDNMKEDKVRIKVGGYIEMSRENLDTIMSYPDPHIGMIFCLHMGFVDSDNLEFDIPD